MNYQYPVVWWFIILTNPTTGELPPFCNMANYYIVIIPLRCILCGTAITRFTISRSLKWLKKRFSYSAGFKLEVVTFAKVNGNMAAQRKLGPTEKLIRDWRQKEDKLKKDAQDQESLSRQECKMARTRN